MTTKSPKRTQSYKAGFKVRKAKPAQTLVLSSVTHRAETKQKLWSSFVPALTVLALVVSLFGTSTVYAANNYNIGQTPTVTVNGNQVTISGTADGNYAGQADQQFVAIDWDNTGTASCGSWTQADSFNLTDSGPQNAFTATWSGSHTFPVPGIYPVSAMIYHQNCKGGESAVVALNVEVVASKNADLSVTKTASVSTASVDDAFTYTVTVTNNGNDTANGVEVMDIIPAGLSYFSNIASQGSYSDVTHVWAVGDMAMGDSATLTITVTVDHGMEGLTFTNTASVSSATADSNSQNNSSSVSVTINAAVPAQPATTFHFIKQICPSYSDIQGNEDAPNFDFTGGQYVNFSNYSTSTPNFPAFSGTVTPTEIPEGCEGAAGWYFNLDDNQGMSSPTAVGPTDAQGKFDVTVDNLPSEAKSLVTSGSDLWIAEVTQESADFGAIRCYTDALNGDNLEYVNLGSDTSAWPTDIYCIAYNVAQQSQTPMFTLTVTKSGDGNGTVDGFVDGATSTPFCGLDQCNTDKEQQAFTHSYASGTVVTLTPTPDENSNFNGTWSGACSGTAPCTLVMTGNLSANAHFGLNSNNNGGGCSSNCGGGGSNNTSTTSGGGGNGGGGAVPVIPQGQVLGESTTTPVVITPVVFGATLPRTGIPGEEVLGLAVLSLAGGFISLRRKK